MGERQGQERGERVERSESAPDEGHAVEPESVRDDEEAGPEVREAERES